MWEGISVLCKLGEREENERGGGKRKKRSSQACCSGQQVGKRGRMQDASGSIDRTGMVPTDVMVVGTWVKNPPDGFC